MSCARTRNDGASDSLQAYLREIQEESLLTAAEECTLANAIALGDSNARSRMIQANLRLVVRIAREYVGRGMGLEDLIGEGNLGLIRAAQEFKPRFGTRFSTYASHWIKQAIRHALINTTPTIRLPAHMVGLLTKWRRAERALCRENGREPSFGEVASLLGLSEMQKSLVAKAHQARQLKLESNVIGENDNWSPVGAYDRAEAPESVLEADDERRILQDRLGLLEERERTVLALRYGLNGELPLTLKEIGRRLGVTREWARKIELKAVRKLDADGGGEPAGNGRGWGQSRFRRRGADAGRVASDAVEPSTAATSGPGPRPARARRRASFAMPAAQPAMHAI
jgi:RNA polymerase primary sigma factor